MIHIVERVTYKTMGKTYIAKCKLRNVS